MKDIVKRLRMRSESWETADGIPLPDGTDASLDREAADEIECLRAERDAAEHSWEQLRALIIAWADAEDAMSMEDYLSTTSARDDAADELRKAVGR